MQNEKLNKILSQIMGLMALANSSPYPEESASAMDMARKLMLKYNIDETDLSRKSPNEEVIEIDFAVAHSDENYTIQIAYWLAESFMVKTMMVKTNVGEDKIKFETSLRFIGKRADVSVSTFVYAYMCSILVNKANEYNKTHKGKRAKQDFSLGFVNAVCEKLKILKVENEIKMSAQETEQVNALVVIKNALINKYMDEKYGKDRFEGGGQNVNVDPNAYQAGVIEGEKHGIFRGVEEKVNSKPKLNS